MRGATRRLQGVEHDVELVDADIRDAGAVSAAVRGCDAVYHLAYINGTRYFYEMPETVLEVGVKGTLNVLDAVEEHGVGRLLYASSSEVYQTPPTVPTDETVPASIPDVTNPRYSYGGGKLIGELLTLNYTRSKDFSGLVFRPHNIYGPDMGGEHVIPAFCGRIADIKEKGGPFAMQGDGSATRAFCHIDDCVQALLLLLDRGERGGVYHVGDDRDEITIRELAERLLRVAGVEADFDFESLPLPSGATNRRCPDVGRLRALGYEPSKVLDEGLAESWAWYSTEGRRLKLV
jgi:nucleoside-diphosphate-sugar epimerase